MPLRLGPLAASLWTAAVVAFASLPVIAGEPPLADDLPVPGGIAAVASAAGALAAPDPERFASELPRLLYSRPDSDNSLRVDAVARVLSTSAPAIERAPIPLGLAFWRDVVFHRPLTPERVIPAILSDRSAALLCRGLAGVDDETRRFIAGHPALVAHIRERGAAAFAAFAGSVRLDGTRVIVVGGPDAASLWARALDASPDDPATFLDRLLSRRAGRVAYLYDTIAHLDEPHRRFALGVALPAARRHERFERLVKLAVASSPEWDVQRWPFERPTSDLRELLRNVRVTERGTLAPPSGRDFWARAFDRSADADDADVVWLAERMLDGAPATRQLRLEQFAFGQRVFGDEPTAAAAEVVRRYPRLPMLMLALERLRIRSPATYQAAADAASRLVSASAERSVIALTQFQGAIALMVRAVAVGTLDRARADALVIALARLPLADGEYLGGVAQWMRADFLPALTVPDGDADARVEHALAGAAPPEPATVVWDEEPYVVDLAAAERTRLGRIRQALDAPRLTIASADPAHDDAAARRQIDRRFAGAIKALVYAAALGQPEEPALLANFVGRHDFGLADPDRAARLPWAEPREQLRSHRPRLVAGALLNLDLALARFWIVRIDTGRLYAPTVNPADRQTLAQSVALMNPYDLRNHDLEVIASAIAAGRARVAVAGRDLGALADTIQMDGWRLQAMRWSIARGGDPLDFFSLAELLALGDPSAAGRLGAWGMSARPADGCACTVLAAPPAWSLYVGRATNGAVTTQVADLHLAVALLLHERHLPAALAPAVLAAATQDYIETARPLDPDDWLGLVRAARTVAPARLDDYFGALTSGGPLIPKAAGTDRER